MKKRICIISLMLLTAISITAHEKDFPKLTGPYLGQTPPGLTPEIFAPGIVSTDFYHHCSPSISPDGKEIYWAMAPLDAMRQIYFSKWKDDRWTKAENLGNEFSEATCPYVSPEGKYLFFLEMGQGYNDVYWVDAKIIKEMKH